jgi:hypothetical protein
MTDEERERALAESRATLERIKDIKRPDTFDLPPLRDRLEEWREWHAERDAERSQADCDRRRIERKIQQQQVEQQTDIETRIAQAVVNEHEFMTDVLVGVVVRMRKEMHDEIQQAFQRQLASLKLEVDALRQEITKFIGSDVKELPNVLQYKRNQVNVN